MVLGKTQFFFLKEICLSESLTKVSTTEHLILYLILTNTLRDYHEINNGYKEPIKIVKIK